MFDTQVLKINDIDSYETEKIIETASEILRQGYLVAFPTETVYGLGANALDTDAVAGIYKAKGRPSDNPLIVHVAEKNEIEPLVRKVPEYARKLIDKFWPGPLTLIFPKSDKVPSITTGGIDTVAIRMPSNKIANHLIKKCGFPIAAPSANRSGRPSPTAAEHVLTDMDGRIPLIIDGGRADIGVESTVLNLVGDIPTILRPGGVTKEMLEQTIGSVKVDPNVMKPLADGAKVMSPGMKYHHYAPKANVTIIDSNDITKIAAKINEMYDSYTNAGEKVGILATEETAEMYTDKYKRIVGSRKNPITIAENLFDSFRLFDGDGVDHILAESVPTVDIGLAIMNRMGRAAAFDIINV